MSQGICAKATIIILLAVFLGLKNIAFASDLEIKLEQRSTESVLVSYYSDQSVNRLQFKNTPDDSRAEFWKPVSDEFELVHLDGSDTIRRIDAKPFKHVALVVKVVDISLPKYYRPFSPLFGSVNGVVVHSGQFFVCAKVCNETTESWPIEIKSKEINVVHFEGQQMASESWLDSGDGRPFYLGSLVPEESRNLRTIIDPGLPSKLQTLLTEYLPAIVDRLAEKFNVNVNKPLVFASYNVGDAELSGFQGSVLNHTVTMHWWGWNLEERINEAAELWFFAHEIAHFYQSNESAVDVDEVAWIHEGFAELMAAVLLAETNHELNLYAQSRFASTKTECRRGLATTSIGTATEQKQFDLHYKCGLLLHRFIIAKAGLNVFTLWNLYRDAINTGKPPSKQTYFDVIQPRLNKEEFSLVKTIVGSELITNEQISAFMNDLDW